MAPVLDPGTDEDLFVAELEPPDHAFEELRSAEPEAVVRLWAGKRNRVAVRRPALNPVLDSVPAEVGRSLGLPWCDESCSLVSVAFTVGCLPDAGCQFTWLQAELRLGVEPPSLEPLPIACRLYPERAEDEVKVVRKFDVSIDAGLAFVGVEGPSIGAGRATERAFTSYRYHVVTFGRMGSTPVWHLRSTDVHREIIGDFTLLAVVAVPPGRGWRGAVSVSAEAQLGGSGPKVPLLMKRTARDVAGSAFDLRPGG
jgi:hypothetical protein